jgi:hypothetical protein
MLAAAWGAWKPPPPKEADADAALRRLFPTGKF